MILIENTKHTHRRLTGRREGSDKVQLETKRGNRAREADREREGLVRVNIRKILREIDT